MIPTSSPQRPGLLLALRFAFREMRGGLRGFGIFLACIALGVTTIAGVASVARGMTDGIAREGQSILGGDFAVEVVHRQLPANERAYLEGLGEVSEVATLRAMARRADGADQALVELKAVDDAYPLFGTLSVDGGGEPETLLARRDGFHGALVEPELLARLNLSLGDPVQVGAARFVIRGVIASEPDRLGGGFSLGPRLMIASEAIAETALIQPGSLVDWRYRVRLPGSPDNAAVAQVAAEALAAFPNSAWDLDTRNDAAPGLRRNIQRLAEFLTLIGLAALVVGGVGVANAVANYLDGKRRVIATLKCLGAPAGFVVSVYLAQILILAGLGILIGLLLGMAVPYLASSALSLVLPVTIAGLYPFELLLAAVYGLATALAFALFPLGIVRRVGPAALFREDVAPANPRPSPAFALATAAAVLLLISLAIGLASDRRIATVFVVATICAFLLLRVVALGVMAAARRAPRVRSAEARLALGNLHRPGSLTPSVVLSLGLGLTLVVALILIDGNFRRALVGSIPERAPTFFILDLQREEVEDLRVLVDREASGAALDVVPFLRGRVVSVAGVPADQVDAAEEVRWVLRGDRGVTYAAELPSNSRLSAGSWWPEGHDGPPLVSVEREVAEGLKLKLGDEVTVNVLGRDVTGRVANFRDLEWQSMAINFVFVFSPDAFRGAPFANLASLTLPPPESTEAELALLGKMTGELPGITVIRIREALETVNELTVRIGWAVRAGASIALVASVLVLAGAFAAGRRQRVHDAVILKTLGATRGRILAAFSLEFLMVGLATALFGLAAGTLAAWYVLERVMQLSFGFLPGPALGAAMAALVVVMGFGLLGTWRVLGQKPAPVLRNL